MTSAASLPRLRTRWAAIGAAVAVAIGAGAIATVDAARSSGERTSYFPITPCRLADTRPATQVGDRSTPLGANDTHTFDARGAIGNCSADDLPVDAAALALNVTAIGPTDNTFVTFWPEGDRPDASSLNPAVGSPPTPNAVTVPLSGDGEFRAFNRFGSVHLVIDVVGFHADHDHDDRYARLHDRVRMAYASNTTNFGGAIPFEEPSSVDDVVEATISAPAGGSARLVVATATVHANTSGPQASTWTLDRTPMGGVTTEAVRRGLYIVATTLAASPADTITMSTSLVQQPGETHTFAVSGRRVDGVPLANINVELTVISSPLDGAGAIPS